MCKRIHNAELSNGDDAMFEGAFYYDFGNGVMVLETEQMRFKLAKWRRKRKTRGEPYDFASYVTDVFATLANQSEPSKGDFDLTEGYDLLARVERANLAMEKANPELKRREILRNYTNPRSGTIQAKEEDRSTTPDEETKVCTPIQTNNLGQTVTIKRSESKLEKASKKVTKKLSEMTPADYGIEGLDIEAEMAAFERANSVTATTANQPSPATEKIVAEATAEFSSVKTITSVGYRKNSEMEKLEREVNEIMAEHNKEQKKPTMPLDYVMSPGTIDQINSEVDQFMAKRKKEKLPMPSLKTKLQLSDHDDIDDQLEETVNNI